MLDNRYFTWSVKNSVLSTQTPLSNCPAKKCGFITPDTPWKDQSRHVVSAHWPTHLPIKKPNLEKQRWRRRFDWSRGVDWWPVSKYGNRCQQHWNTTPSLNAVLWRLSLQTWQNFLARAILIVGKGGHWTVKTFEVISGLPEDKEVTKQRWICVFTRRWPWWVCGLFWFHMPAKKFELHLFKVLNPRQFLELLN